MIVNIKGRVIKTVDFKEGTTDNGFKWWKRDILIDVFGPQKSELCITFFKDFADDFKNNYKDDDEIELEIEILSKEYKGKYYTNINCKDIVMACDTSKVEDNTGNSSIQEEIIRESETQPKEDDKIEENDLPF